MKHIYVKALTLNNRAIEIAPRGERSLLNTFPFNEAPHEHHNHEAEHHEAHAEHQGIHCCINILIE